jgi:hypothetical protein
MTSFFHDLEDQLRTAARERTTAAHPGGEAVRLPSRRRRRWLAGGARLAPVALAVGVALAVLVGALVLLGHRGGNAAGVPAARPASHGIATLVRNTPPPQLHRELILIGNATRKVLSSPACRVTQPLTAPQIHQAPGAALLSTLGVLRRPATAADRLAPRFTSMAGAGVSVYAGAARRVGTAGRTTYYLVPVRRDPAAAFPSARCFVLQQAALEKALPHAAPALRGPTRELDQAFLAHDRSLAAMPPADGVCVVTVQGGGSGSACLDTVPEIRHGVIPGDDNGTFAGIAPDGVTSVTLSFPAMAGHRGRSFTAPVHDNLYAAHAGSSEPLRAGSPVVTWRARGGHVLRTYSEPSPMSVQQVCKQHPSACAAMVLASAPLTSSRSSSTGKLQKVPYQR